MVITTNLAETNYPISGSLMPFLLIAEWVVCFLFLELGIVLWIRARVKRKELKTIEEKGVIGILIGYSLMWNFFIIGDYYVSNSELRLFLFNIGYLCIIIGANMFVYEIEKSKIFYKKRYITIIFTAISIIYVIVLFTNVEYGFYAINAFWPFLFLFLLLYLKKIIVINKKKRQLHTFHRVLFEFSMGGALLIVGYGLTTDLGRELLGAGLEIRLLGDILQLTSSIFIVLFIISTPSFSEYGWRGKIDRIIIMHKSGLLLFQRRFRDASELDGPLISGILTTLKMLLERIIDKESASVIEKQDKILIIQPGKYINGVLICDEMLLSLRTMLTILVNKIEAIYSKILENWTGDLKIFGPIEEIVKDVFF